MRGGRLQSQSSHGEPISTAGITDTELNFGYVIEEEILYNPPALSFRCRDRRGHDRPRERREMKSYLEGERFANCRYALTVLRNLSTQTVLKLSSPFKKHLVANFLLYNRPVVTYF